MPGAPYKPNLRNNLMIALLLIGHDRAPEVYAFLDRREVPYLIAWAYNPSTDRLCVGFDNRAAMQALAAAVKSGESTLEARREGYKAGVNTNFEVLEAVRDLYGFQR